MTSAAARRAAAHFVAVHVEGHLREEAHRDVEAGDRQRDAVDVGVARMRPACWWWRRRSAMNTTLAWFTRSPIVWPTSRSIAACETLTRMKSRFSQYWSIGQSRSCSISASRLSSGGSEAARSLSDSFGLVVEDGDEEAALAAEVAVDEALGAAGALGDLARSGGVVALLGEDLRGGLDQADLALVLVVLAALDAGDGELLPAVHGPSFRECVSAHFRSRAAAKSSAHARILVPPSSSRGA